MFDTIISFLIILLPPIVNDVIAEEFVVTTYPRMEKYLESLKFEFVNYEKEYPPHYNICKNLRAAVTRMITLEADEGQDSEFNSDWHSLFKLDDSVVKEVTYASKMEQTAAIQEFGYHINGYSATRNKLLCYWNINFNVYLVFDIYNIHTNYLLVVEDVDSKSKHILGLVFSTRSNGLSRRPDVPNVGTIERSYYPREDAKENPQLCSLKPHELLHLCATALFEYWDPCTEVIDDDMPKPQRHISIEFRDYNCYDGKLQFPDTGTEGVNAKFRPCILKHSGNSETIFHVTLTDHLYLAKNKGGDEYHLYAWVYKRGLYVKSLM